ncbi:MAG TPA: DUF86 domain-containing protein [Candidatus Cloacimonadota bacterium]|nr:DUF86 domain-containing protein [Candidatus Cloacimonadota bacterium]
MPKPCMLPEDKIRIQHILDEIDNIQTFIGNVSYQEFIHDKKTVNAIIRSIEIIGEAASKISDDYKSNHSEIPWKQIVGMRNHLIHVYFDVDYQTLWQTVKSDIPDLKLLISNLL